MTQDDKKVALYISGTIYHMSFMVHMSKMMISPGVFFFLFHVLEILIYGFNSGVKEQKMAYNEKKLCLSHSISE